MSKFWLSILGIFFLLVSIYLIPIKIYAQTCSIIMDQTQISSNFNGNILISTEGRCIVAGISYTVDIYPPRYEDSSDLLVHPYKITTPTVDDSIVFNINLSITRANSYPGTWILRICRTGGGPSNCSSSNIVASARFEIVNKPPPPAAPPTDLPKIQINSQTQCTFQISSVVNLTVTNIQADTIYAWWWDEGLVQPAQELLTSDPSGSDLSITIPSTKTQDPGDKRLCIDREMDKKGNLIQPARRKVSVNCISLKFTLKPPAGDTSCNSIGRGPVGVCTDDLNQECQKKGETCINGQCTKPPPPASAGGIQCDQEKGILTAIGCIHTSPAGFVKDFLTFVIGISGGLAFLMMLLGAFQMLTSAGNPDALNAGKDRLTNAIIGLLIVIFAVLLLQIIGADILHIPGFKP